MGVLGGAHCAVMCGPVASVVCRKPSASFGFNAGRVATYGLLGAVAGAFGALSPLIGIALRPLAAVALVALGLHLAGISHLFAKVEKLGAPLWRKIEPLTHKPLPITALGALWGFVPCGLVYAALTLAANAGSALGGAIAALAFGLGTLPVMATLGVLASPVRNLCTRPLVRRTVGVIVLLLGVHQTRLAFAAVDLVVLRTTPPVATELHCH